MEKWDLYDKDLKITDMKINKGDKIPSGFFHLSSEVWILNDKKELLIVRNALDYSRLYPGLWTHIWDYVLSGENAKQAIIRILNTRIGLKIEEKDLIELDLSKNEQHKFAYATFLVKKNIDLNSIFLIDGFAISCKWVSVEEINKLIANGEMPFFIKKRMDDYIKLVLESHQ